MTPTRGALLLHGYRGGDRREQALGVRRVVVVQEPGADRAVRGEAEVALELPGVVVAVPDGDLAARPARVATSAAVRPATLNISVGARSAAAP